MEAAMDRRESLDAVRPRTENPMLDPANKLKLAVFSANVSRGTSLSHATTLPVATWDESQRLAKAADRAGIDAMIPLARWKNPARSRPEYDRFLECFTWAAGLSAVTERISLFATVHVPFFHPLIVAGMASTIDQISGGRFGINIVAGAHSSDFPMFGIEQIAHDERYVYADEWITLVKRIWTSEEPFDFEGRYFHGQSIVNRPMPLQRPYPVLMSAGNSGPGRAFATTHADLRFLHLPSFEALPETIKPIKEEMASRDHEVQIMAGGYIVCDDTEAAARRRYEYTVRDQIDIESTDALLNIGASASASANVDASRNDFPVEPSEWRDRTAAGFAALPLVGTAEHIAERMIAMSEGGLDGITLSFDNYDDGIAAYDEAIRPLLVQAGIRADSE